MVAFLKYSQISQNIPHSVVFDRLLRFYGWEFDEKVLLVDVLHESVIVNKAGLVRHNKFQRADLEVMDPLCP